MTIKNPFFLVSRWQKRERKKFDYCRILKLNENSQRWHFWHQNWFYWFFFFGKKDTESKNDWEFNLNFIFLLLLLFSSIIVYHSILVFFFFFWAPGCQNKLSPTTKLIENVLTMEPSKEKKINLSSKSWQNFFRFQFFGLQKNTMLLIDGANHVIKPFSHSPEYPYNRSFFHYFMTTRKKNKCHLRCHLHHHHYRLIILVLNRQKKRESENGVREMISKTKMIQNERRKKNFTLDRLIPPIETNDDDDR